MTRIIYIGVAFLVGLVTMWVFSIALRENRITTLASGHELVKKVSPDGANTAFVWLPELSVLGATISQPYQVWIKNKRFPEEKHLVFESDKTNWLLLSWHSPDLLEICYGEVQINRFQNHSIIVERNNGLSKILEIEIVLKKVQNQNDC